MIQPRDATVALLKRSLLRVGGFAGFQQRYPHLYDRIVTYERRHMRYARSA